LDFSCADSLSAKNTDFIYILGLDRNRAAPRLIASAAMASARAGGVAMA
jgi:hypothetical protein